MGKFTLWPADRGRAGDSGSGRAGVQGRAEALYLVLNLAEKEDAAREWIMAKAQLAILFKNRFKLA